MRSINPFTKRWPEWLSARLRACHSLPRNLHRLSNESSGLHFFCTCALASVPAALSCSHTASLGFLGSPCTSAAWPLHRPFLLPGRLPSPVHSSGSFTFPLKSHMDRALCYTLSGPWAVPLELVSVSSRDDYTTASPLDSMLWTERASALLRRHLPHRTAPSTQCVLAEHTASGKEEV